MPQAEQSRSAIFETKPVDLKGCKTTLMVILLLLIYLATLTKRVRWKCPCNIKHREEQSEGPIKTGGKAAETWQSRESQGSESKGEVNQSFKGTHSYPPIHRMTKSLQDQNTNSFKEKLFTVSAQSGNVQPYHLGSNSFPSVPCVLRWENNSVLQDPTAVALESFLTENFRPYVVV